MATPAVEVLLVDEDDNEIGRCEKLEAHRRGVLHRAVSVFVFDERGRTLVQQRAAGKYHSGGQWSNAACTHPRAGETLEDAVRRAVREELNTELAELRPVLRFTYRAEVGAGLVEHELDHVFVARLAAPAVPVPEEVAAMSWWTMPDLAASIAAEPERFTPWFRLLVPELQRIVAPSR